MENRKIFQLLVVCLFWSFPHLYGASRKSSLSHTAYLHKMLEIVKKENRKSARIRKPPGIDSVQLPSYKPRPQIVVTNQYGQPPVSRPLTPRPEQRVLPAKRKSVTTNVSKEDLKRIEMILKAKEKKKQTKPENKIKARELELAKIFTPYYRDVFWVKIPHIVKVFQKDKEKFGSFHISKSSHGWEVHSEDLPYYEFINRLCRAFDLKLILEGNSPVLERKYRWHFRDQEQAIILEKLQGETGIEHRVRKGVLLVGNWKR
ncbi:hypothetical protein ACFL35_19765 [Candidatus Riflebacteria bacterium]